jgi:YVTN family beta-propeller protein
MARYGQWRRLRGDTSRLDLLDLGKRLLGYLAEQRQLSGVKTMSAQRRLPDGSVVRVRFDGDMPVIEIMEAGKKERVVTDCFLYVAGGGDDVVTVVSTLSRRAIKHIDCGANTFPFHCAVSPSGARVYVACNGSGASSYVKVISTASLEVIATIDMPPGFIAMKLCVHPDGSKVYVTGNGSGTVLSIDTGDDSIVGESVVFGDSPFGIAILPDGSKMYAGRSDSTMESPYWQVLDEDLAMVGAVDMDASTLVGDANPTNNAPAELAITRDGTVAVCCVQNRHVVFIDTETDAILGACSTNAGLGPGTHFEGTIYVCVDPFNADLAYIGCRDAPSVAAVSISAMEEVGFAWMSLAGPSTLVRGMAANPAVREIYAGRFDDGAIQVLSSGESPELLTQIPLTINDEAPGMSHEMWHICPVVTRYALPAT